MTRKVKKILCGPFIGEFGWEISFFSRYVNNLAQKYESEYEIHAASYPGRSCLYSDLVIFHKHPPWFSSLNISHNAYIADQWINKWPKINNSKIYEINIQSKYFALKKYYMDNFGTFEHILSPAELFRDLSGTNDIYGTFIPLLKNKNSRQINFAIPLENQLEAPITLKNESVLSFEKNYGHEVISDTFSIAVLPRMRWGRRPDKNWGEENYRNLISKLQKYFNKINIFIIGSPGGCYFSNGDVPLNTIDLVNIPDADRLAVQLAALRGCKFAIGGLSGAMLVCLAAKTPVIEWGWPIHMAETRRLNYLNTPLTYINSNNPSVESVLDIAKSAIFNDKVENHNVNLVDVPLIKTHRHIFHRALQKFHEIINKIEFSLYIFTKGNKL